VATGSRDGRTDDMLGAGRVVWSLRQRRQQQMKQQSMDGRAYCGKHALIGSEPAGCGRSGRLAAAAADTRQQRR